MHLSLHQKLHSLEQFFHLIEHHKLVAIVVTIVTLWLLYVLNNPVDYPTDAGQIPQPNQPRTQALLTQRQPLTLMDHPQHIHEYDARLQYITRQLEDLREKSRADRAYVLAYNHGLDVSGNALEIQISQTVEVVGEGIPSQINAYQTLSRYSWLEMKGEQERVRDFFSISPRTYGTELYDQHHTAIGYIGLDYLRHDEDIHVSEQDLRLLQHTADTVKAGLLASLETLSIFEQ